MKIVFMGTPAAAAVSLQRLIDDGHEIRAVYTRPDRPSGRGQKLTPSPVKQLTVEHELTVLQPIKLRTPEALETFRSHAADVAVVVAYGRILPESFLDVFRYGAVNVHFSLLPKYRGAAPVNWAMANGEAETGVTTMKMDAGLDTGPVLLQRSTPILASETAPELMERLAEMGAELLLETLSSIQGLVPKEQEDGSATLAPILKKEDGLIDWSRPAKQIVDRVRGFQPFPGSYTFLGNIRLTIWRASATSAETSNAALGEVLEASGDILRVACGDGEVFVHEIQPEGKRRMSVRDFLNGTKLKSGALLGTK